MSWPDPSATAKLIAEAGAGEPEAVDRLLDDHREPIRRFVASRLDRRLSPRLDASDVVQEVMLDVSRRLSDYLRQPTIPFHLWLRQIAKDRLIDAHRRHRAAERRTIDRERRLTPPAFADQSSIDLAAQLCDPNLTPASHAIRAELERRFQEALTSMEQADREVLILRHVEKLASRETAELLGMTPAAAGMRYLRALRRLRAILGENPPQH